MALYHPRILAYKLEELVAKLLSWSYSVTQLHHHAQAQQSRMDTQLAGVKRTADLLANQLVRDRQAVMQVDAVLVAQTVAYVEAKREVDQVCAIVQRAYDEAQQAQAYWQAELAKAEQRVMGAMEALQRGEKEPFHAERELSRAQAYANKCKYALNSASEALRVAREVQQSSVQGADALGRSHEHVVAAQKAFEQSKTALQQEEGFFRAAEEVVKSAQTALDNAADSLHSALLHEQSSQAYQAQARGMLDGKIQALVALNQPDNDHAYGEANGASAQAGSVITDEPVGVKAALDAVFALTESGTALSEKEYGGPKSDPELQSLVERLSRNTVLMTPERWSKLSEERKLELLRKVHKDIARIYGFAPCEIEIRTMQDKLRGAFSDRKNRIMINRKLVSQDHPRQVISTLSHETRHAYQYAAMKQHFWMLPADRRRAVKLWEKNWDNYQEANEGYEDYYKQPIEADARAFADAVVRQIYGGK